ncbi:MAG: SPOR domain-containing protein [Clostridia bacterium]|nr:SPOR domain-containing protein [Clostridia bacterium]
MGRVEQRMYKRRLKRRRAGRMLLLLALVIVGVILWLRRAPAPMKAELVTTPSPTPLSSTFDQSVESRDVTLEQRTWYAIQTGVFSTQEAALEKADAYADRGAPGVVVQDGAKWRVFIACYGDEGDAESVRTRLGENQRVETYLYTWSCPELRLRLTGMAGQLDVVEAGLSLLMQTAEQLRDAAILLDAGELTASEAAGQVASMDGAVALWADTARERFGSSIPSMVGQLLALTESWTARCEALEKASSSATALSAELKGQGMAMFDDMVQLRRNLSAQ